jgi:hypothetical protein
MPEFLLVLDVCDKIDKSILDGKYVEMNPETTFVCVYLVPDSPDE